MFKKLFVLGSFLLVGGIASANPNYLYSTSTLKNGTTFYVSSGTVAGQLTAGGNSYPTTLGSVNQCLITNGAGALSFGACANASAAILNQNTLQSGSTAYPQYLYVGSSVTISGASSATSYSGNGASLTALNGSNISSGVVGTSYLPSGSGGILFSTNTLQSGTTAYPQYLYVGSSATISGTLTASTLYVGTYTYTNWQSYTPTITGVGTASQVGFFWRQERDVIFVTGFFTSGTPSGAALSITLPNSTVIGTGKIAPHTVGLGTSQILPNSGPTNLSIGQYPVPFYDGSTSNLVFFGNQFNNGGFVKNVGTTFFSSGDSMTLNFSYPI